MLLCFTGCLEGKVFHFFKVVHYLNTPFNQLVINSRKIDTFLLSDRRQTHYHYYEWTDHALALTQTHTGSL